MTTNAKGNEMTNSEKKTIEASQIQHGTLFIHANGKTYMVAGEPFDVPTKGTMVSYFSLRDGVPSGAIHKCGLDKIVSLI
jgi:hypothetical protein